MSFFFSSGDADMVCGAGHAVLLKNTGLRAVPVVLARWTLNPINGGLWEGEDYGPCKMTQEAHDTLMRESAGRLRCYRDVPIVMVEGSS